MSIASAVLETNSTESGPAAWYATRQGVASIVVMESHLASRAFKINLLREIVEYMPRLLIYILGVGPRETFGR